MGLKVGGLNQENILREKAQDTRRFSDMKQPIKAQSDYETTNQITVRLSLNETREIEDEATITNQSNLTNNVK